MGKFQRKPAGAQLSDRKSEEINKRPDIASQIRLLRVEGKKKKTQAVCESEMGRGSIKTRASEFKVGIPNRGRGTQPLRQVGYQPGAHVTHPQWLCQAVHFYLQVLL